MKNADHHLFYRLLFSALVCFQALTAFLPVFGASWVNMTVTFHNVGTNSWFNGVTITEQFVNPGSPYLVTENPVVINYYTDAAIAPGASHSVYFPANSSPIYGPSYAPSLSSAYYWTADASGPTWPSQQPASGLSSSWSGSGSDILTCALTVDVNTNCYGYISCMSNVAFEVHNNTLSTQWFYQALAPGAGQSVAGVLMLTTGSSGYSVGSWPCSQAGSVVLYSCTVAPSWTGGSPDGTMTGLSADDTASPVPGATPSFGAGSGSGGGGVGAGAGGTPPLTSYSPPTTMSYNPTNWSVTGSNQPILFSGGTGTNGTVAEGFSALYTIAVSAAELAHSDAQAINAAVVGVSNVVGLANGSANAMAVSNAMVQNGLFVSNAVARINASGVTNVSVSNLGQITNLLGGLLGATMTNGLDVSNAIVNLAGIGTNGLTFGQLTNALGTYGTNGMTFSQYTNGLGLMGETNGLTFDQFTNGLAMLGATNAPEWTNGLTFEQYSNSQATYQQAATDNVAVAWSEIMAKTNQAGSLAYSTAVTPDTFSVGLGDSGGGGASQAITVGGGGSTITYVFANAIMPAYPGLRTLCYWCIVVTVFCYCYKTFEKKVQGLFFVPQAVTSGQSFAGFNANFPGAIAMAAAIVGVIAALVSMGLPVILGMRDSISTMGNNPFTAMHGTFAWQFLSDYVPLDMLASAVVTVIAYRIFMGSLATVAAGVLKFLVGP